MHNLLLVKAFEKAKKQEQEKGIKKPSDHSLAKIISEFISNEKTAIGEKRLSQYYKSALNKTEDINIPQLGVILGLCNFLGYDSYEDFIENNRKKDKKENNILFFFQSQKIKISISIIVLAVIFIIVSINQQRWMVWKDNHYIEVKFDTEKFNVEQLKLYKEDRIKYFRKVEVDCNTQFFNESGNVKIWYGKNHKKELEYFTDLGLHPETGKSLNPITKYMIKKYICKSY